MKQTTGLLLITMMTAMAWAQSAQTVQNVKSNAAAAQQQKAAQQNAAVKGTQAQAAKSAVVVKPVTPAPKPQVSNAKPGAGVAAKPAQAIAVKPAQSAAAKPQPTKIAVAPVAPQPKQGAQKVATASRAKKPAKASSTVATKSEKPAQTSNSAKASEAAKGDEPSEESKEKKTITAQGRRDPFLSPVVNSPTGPGCSTGKRCLAIDQIIVRGVVKSDAGMFAVVVNSMNKAYFLRENDPVFNGYVLKITGDSVVFKETYQDKLGKEFTREVVKRITTPAV
ncbi:MAG TPA: hypothetical protein VFI95_24735 [Terriglobales bacterium]|nr:hypothetical protein [Terriglobales bacterium]